MLGEFNVLVRSDEAVTNDVLTSIGMTVEWACYDSVAPLLSWACLKVS
jgi:hypothetical protein